MDPASAEKIGSVTVVRVGPDDGSLQEVLLDRVRHFLLGCAQEANPPNFVVDLGDTDFFGGEFMGILCRCIHKIRGRHGEFALCNPRPELLDELRVARFHRLCKIYATRDEAVDAMDERLLSPVP